MYRAPAIAFAVHTITDSDKTILRVVEEIQYETKEKTTPTRSGFLC